MQPLPRPEGPTEDYPRVAPSVPPPAPKQGSPQHSLPKKTLHISQPAPSHPGPMQVLPHATGPGAHQDRETLGTRGSVSAPWHWGSGRGSAWRPSSRWSYSPSSVLSPAATHTGGDHFSSTRQRAHPSFPALLTTGGNGKKTRKKCTKNSPIPGAPWPRWSLPSIRPHGGSQRDRRCCRGPRELWPNYRGR